MKRFAVALLAGLLALTLAPGVAEAKKKPGPPPKTTTKQIQGWVTDEIKRQNSSCNPDSTYYPCTLEIKWSNIRWLGTTKECVKGGGFGKPCLEYGTAYVARTSIIW